MAPGARRQRTWADCPAGHAIPVHLTGAHVRRWLHLLPCSWLHIFFDLVGSGLFHFRGTRLTVRLRREGLRRRFQHPGQHFVAGGVFGHG